MGTWSGQLIEVVHLRRATFSHIAGSATRKSLGVHLSSPSSAVSPTGLGSPPALALERRHLQVPLQHLTRLGVSGPALSAFSPPALSCSPALVSNQNLPSWRSSTLNLAPLLEESCGKALLTTQEVDTESTAAVMRQPKTHTEPLKPDALSMGMCVGQDTPSLQKVPLLHETVTDEDIVDQKGLWINEKMTDEGLVEQQGGKTCISLDLGTIAFWLLAVPVSVPFLLYASVIAFGGEAAIRQTTAGALDAAVDAGQHIMDHLPLWRLHATCAMLYTCATPVQFLPIVRKRLPSLHRASGYLFLLSGGVLAVSGLIMAPVSEFPGFVPASTALAVAWSVCGGVALWLIMKGHVQEHRRWMIRAAAAGYSSIMTRPLASPVHYVTGLSYRESTAPTLWLALSLSLIFAEIYIWKLSRVR